MGSVGTSAPGSPKLTPNPSCAARQQGPGAGEAPSNISFHPYVLAGRSYGRVGLFTLDILFLGSFFFFFHLLLKNEGFSSLSLSTIGVTITQ